MRDWPERYAQALGVAPLSDEEVEVVLDLARDIAHGSERRFAPLSTFLAGMLAGSRGEAGRQDALDFAVRAARDLIGSQREG